MKLTVMKTVCVLSILLANIGCDQATKHLAQKHIKHNGIINVIGDFFVLQYAENNGAFLSMFSGLDKTIRVLLLTIIPSIALLLALVYLFLNLNLPYGNLIGLAFIIGGGLSNVFDRIFNNESVIDFMNIGIGSLRSGIFNLADLSIMLGAGLLVYYAYLKNTVINKTKNC